MESRLKQVPSPPNTERLRTDLLNDVAVVILVNITNVIGENKDAEIGGRYNMPTEALKSDIEEAVKILQIPFGNVWKEEQVLQTG